MLRCLPSRRLGALVVALTVGLSLATAATSTGDLASRRDQLRSAIGAESRTLRHERATVSSLRQRLGAIESSLAVQRARLRRVQAQLATARTRLSQLRRRLAAGRSMLAAQLVAQYESPRPDLVRVALEAKGFTDLLERIRNQRMISDDNAAILREVARDRAAVAVEVHKLAAAEARQRRVTAAVVVERSQVVALRLRVLKRERSTRADRARKQAQLHSVERKLRALQARAAAAQRASFADQSISGGAPSGGSGFFPAPGTNYTVGQEPQIAERLNALGRALGLHLIGISGYRTPQHSVEVGGFPNDPHTRGEASDTPGVEGVSEATLRRFGLTRPFAGPAEADHIQLG